MTPFLKEVALDVLDKYGDNFENLNFVFQNKRAGIYFKQYLGEIIGRTIWAPNVFEMQSLLKKFTGLVIADDLSLIFELYSAFQKTKTVSDTDTLEFFEFFGIGEIILRDFVDVDSNLVDVTQIFRNIRDLKEIDTHFDYFTQEQKEAIKRFWANFNDQNSSKEKEKFLHLWNKLPEIYTLFTNKLLAQKIGHSGLLYREMANKVKDSSLFLRESEIYLFIGFNALNVAQQKLFTFLNKRGSARFYWDTDKYYINDTNQEAGLFLRQNLERYPNKLNVIPNNLDPNNKRLAQNQAEPIHTQGDKNINLVGVALEVGQAKLIPQLLAEILGSTHGKLNTEKLSKTAIVIANEDFLFPVLYSLPAELENFNVTMGYPLKNTQLYSLLNQYFSLFSNPKSKTFYFKDVLHLIQNPIVRKIDYDTSVEIEKQILKDNIIYIDQNFINAYPSDFINLLFTKYEKVNEFMENLLEILYSLYEPETKKEKKSYSYENEYLYKTYTSVKHINDILQNTELSESLTISLAIKIMKRNLETIRIPFEGKNLEGLQIMGVLETRNLDFENLIIIGMNEGVWLSNNRPPSFVSENLRYAFEMPVMKQQDAIYAYLFYRLIQKAQRITILYNNITGYNSSGELSRFAQQLVFESGLKIEHRQFKQELKPLIENTIEINKTPEILEILADYGVLDGKAKRNFSASALNTYLDCSLKFYFKYIANLKEKKEVEEEISPATFGTILHDTLELIYNKFNEKKEHKTIEKADLPVLLSMVEENLIITFKNQFAKDRPQDHFKIEGSRLIIKEVIQKYIQNILKYDSKIAPFQIVELEYEGLDAVIPIRKMGIAINGKIDRIDKKEDIYRIIDYKTGSVNKEFNSIESMFDSENENRNKAVFQTFFYALLLKQNPDFKKAKTIPGIYDIRKISQSDFSADLTMKDGRNKQIITPNLFEELLSEFKLQLQNLLTGLFNPEIRFTQTSIEKHCSYCAYNEICNK